MDDADAEIAREGVAQTSYECAKHDDDCSYVNNLGVSTFHDWISLPAELKIEVLAHHLDQDGSINHVEHEAIFESHLGPILGTRNREFATLSLKTYYTRNVFKAENVGLHMMYPPAPYGYMVRHLEVELDPRPFVDPTASLGLHKSNALLHLLSPTNITEANSHALIYPATVAWQANFSNLRALRCSINFGLSEFFWVPFNILDMCGACYLVPSEVQKLTKLLAQSFVALKATKVTAFDPDVSSDCGCLDEVLKTIEQIATRSKD